MRDYDETPQRFVVHLKDILAINPHFAVVGSINRLI